MPRPNETAAEGTMLDITMLLIAEGVDRDEVQAGLDEASEFVEMLTEHDVETLRDMDELSPNAERVRENPLYHVSLHDDTYVEIIEDGEVP